MAVSVPKIGKEGKETLLEKGEKERNFEEISAKYHLLLS